MTPILGVEREGSSMTNQDQQSDPYRWGLRVTWTRFCNEPKAQHSHNWRIIPIALIVISISNLACLNRPGFLSRVNTTQLHLAPQNARGIPLFASSPILAIPSTRHIRCLRSERLQRVLIVLEQFCNSFRIYSFNPHTMFPPLRTQFLGGSPSLSIGCQGAQNPNKGSIKFS